MKPSESEPDWEVEVQKLVTGLHILKSDNTDVKVRLRLSFVSGADIDQAQNLRLIGTTVERLLNSASDNASLNKTQLANFFMDSRNLDAFMYKSSLYERAGTESQTAAEEDDDRQLSAKLHCLYGVPMGPVGRRSLATHPYARSRVYDLRNYTDNTKWGPFRNDGSMRVDWEMMESVMIILGYNSGVCCQRFIHRFKPIWSTPFGGIARCPLSDAYPPSLPLEPDIPLDLKDPYGVSGIWFRVSESPLLLTFLR
jgi:hypothetical protein